MARRLAVVLLGLGLALGGPSLCAKAGGTNGWLRVCLFLADLPDDHLGWGGDLKI